MHTIVTGGAGFIGSHLVERLLNDGHTVTVVDDLSSGSRRTIAPHRHRIRFVAGDMGKLWGYQRIDIMACDWCFHLAAKADIVPSIEKPWDYHHANVTGTVAALQYARACGVNRFIYAASSSCYGLATVFPTPEDAPIAPQYPYALTKWVGEQYALHWMQVYGLPVVSLRLFNVFGPRQRTAGTYGAVMGVFLAQKANGQPLTIIGDGTQTRDFTYVTDVVDAMVKAAESDITGVFNVGSGSTHSVDELATLIGGDRISIPKRPGEPDCTFADTRKIRQALDWVPRVPFAEGVRTMLERLDDWAAAPVWTPETIAVSTAAWHRYLG
jgi:UDP-glucose 4-epimerase